MPATGCGKCCGETAWKRRLNMPDLVRNKLSAYLDGELARRDQIEVETHLETCPDCRQEVEELRQLSQEWHAAPLPEFTPALDFKAQLMLQLPRRDETLQSGSNNPVLPWMAPTLVLAGWIFVQVTLGVSTLVLLAEQAGLIDGAAAWAASAPQQMLWFTTAKAAIGSGLGSGGVASLTILNDASLFLQNVVTLLLGQVGVALLYWGAMTLVWQDRVKALWSSFTAG